MVRSLFWACTNEACSATRVRKRNRATRRNIMYSRNLIMLGCFTRDELFDQRRQRRQYQSSGKGYSGEDRKALGQHSVIVPLKQASSKTRDVATNGNRQKPDTHHQADHTRRR